MEEKPKVIISRSRRAEVPVRNFPFTAGMVPGSGILADYRQKAWQTFNRLQLPTMTEEAWRRTDLHELPVDTIHLPADGAFRELTPIPADLLKPLTADRHGGQVVILPGGSKVTLGPELIQKGVVFSDLQTAERQNPELVAKMIGQTVNPEEGKFAALAASLSQNGVVLYIPKGVTVEQPLNSLLWGPGLNLAYLSHILVTPGLLR
jgi:Fe-S cluster assembly protein SufD